MKNRLLSWPLGQILDISARSSDGFLSPEGGQGEKLLHTLVVRQLVGAVQPGFQLRISIRWDLLRLHQVRDEVHGPLRQGCDGVEVP